MILVYGKAEVQKLQLTIVSVEKISSSRTVAAGATHILSQAIESRAFFCISLRIVSIGGSDVILERLIPVDLIRLFQGT